MELFINFANILYLIAYFNRDILRMRLLSVVAAMCLITYFYFRSEPLLVPVYWNLFHMGINVMMIARLMLERVKSRHEEIGSQPAGISPGVNADRKESKNTGAGQSPNLARGLEPIIQPALLSGPFLPHSIKLQKKGDNDEYRGKTL